MPYQKQNKYKIAICQLVLVYLIMTEAYEFRLCTGIGNHS